MRMFAWVPLVALLTGCASALKEPPVRPVAAETLSHEDLVRITSEADRLYRTRTLENVKQAVRLWEQAVTSGDESYETMERLIRARVWICDHERGEEAREEAALAAVHAAQWCGNAWPGSPRCAYWLGVGLGVQARERRSTAIDALRRIEALWYEALEGDPAQDHAGPERALALLYLRAPGWPTGPGDPEAGLEMARAAVERAPDFPPNLMALAEALAENGEYGEYDSVRRRAVESVRRAAEAGDPDAPEWLESLEGNSRGN